MYEPKAYDWKYRDDGGATGSFQTLEQARDWFNLRRRNNTAEYAFLYHAGVDSRLELYADIDGKVRVEKLR